MAPRTLALDVIRPSDTRYERVRHVYSATGSPAAVVLARDAADVAAALEFAREQRAPLAVRSGGHGISSIATNDGGTVIDLSRMNRITSLGGRRVRIGAGARWGEVAHQLHRYRLAISSGDSGDVGVGGLATAGGLGLLGRAHGLTIDHLVAAEIVTADGSVHRVSADEEPDLFWAIRGAGSRVGIVTSFEFDAVRISTVAHGSFAYAVRDVAGFIEQWGRTVEDAPREVSAFLYLAGGFAHATVVYAGPDGAAASRALTPFTALPGLNGGGAQLAPYPTVPATTGAPHTGQQRARTRSGLTVHLDAETARRLALLAGSVEMVQIRSAGGAINDVPPDATAYAHRHQNFSVTAVTGGSAAAFDARWAPVRDRMDGMYLSLTSDRDEDTLSDAFPATTLDRLRTVAARWDPERVFSLDLARRDGSVVTARHRAQNKASVG